MRPLWRSERPWRRKNIEDVRIGTPRTPLQEF